MLNVKGKSKYIYGINFKRPKNQSKQGDLERD